MSFRQQVRTRYPGRSSTYSAREPRYARRRSPALAPAAAPVAAPTPAPIAAPRPPSTAPPMAAPVAPPTIAPPKASCAWDAGTDRPVRVRAVTPARSIILMVDLLDRVASSENACRLAKFLRHGVERRPRTAPPAPLTRRLAARAGLQISNSVKQHARGPAVV